MNLPTSALLAALLLAHINAAADDFKWPKGARAAVSLAYDDALDSQLDIAIPALDKAGLKGSFYLQMSNPAVAKRMKAWRRAAAHGHELGNHTLFHQCSGKVANRPWVQAHRNLDTTTAAQMKDQVQLANTMLHAIDGKRERTFTAPCGEGQALDANYVGLIKQEFVAMKSGGGDAVISSMATLDPDAVLVHAPEGVTGKQLIAMAQDAAARGTMLNLTFHGIGGDYLTVSKEAHAELVAFLAANRKVYWTDTFLNIMRHVRKTKGVSRP